MRKKLLIVSDAPTAPTGLGRICKDLAMRIHHNLSEFDVATFGYGATASRALPFTQYPMTRTENFVAPELVKVWNDFVGDDEGIILSIWNASWCKWLGDPEVLKESPLRDFITARPFQLWGYFPVDGDGPNGTLPGEIGKTIEKYDRVLAYTKYGADVIAKTLPDYVTPHHLPHGLDTSIFCPCDRQWARDNFVEIVLRKERARLQKIFLVGVVATNTPRKDWYLAFETCAKLLDKGIHVGLWAHTNTWRAHWDFQSLQDEFGMRDRVMFTNHEMTDEEMAIGYTACDVTLGIGSGEGWGFPLAESLACGTPVVHGDYAGGAEFVPSEGLAQPVIFRGDGYFGIRRPVFDAEDWADRAIYLARQPRGESLLPPYIDWKNAWPEWKKWLLKGIE